MHRFSIQAGGNLLAFLVVFHLLGPSPAHAVDCDEDLAAPALQAAMSRMLHEDAGCPVPPPAAPSTGPVTWIGRPPQLDEATVLLSKGKAQKATLALAPLLQDDDPAVQGPLLFALAQALENDGAGQTAGVLYEAIARDPTAADFLAPAVQGLSRVTRSHQDLDALTRVAVRVAPGRRPQQDRNLLAYLAMTEHVRAAQGLDARREFDRIHPDSDSYLPALYQAALAFQSQQKLKSAVRSFRDLYRGSGPVAKADDDDQSWRLQVLSILNIGRIYYSIDKPLETSKWAGLLLGDKDDFDGYFDVPNSDRADRVRLEQAWGLFAAGRSERARELLEAIGGSYLPDKHRLRWTMAALGGDLNAALHEVERFEEDYRPVADSLRTLLQAPPEQALAAWTDPDGVAARHPTLAAEVHRSRPLSATIRHLDEIDAEAVAIARKPTVWQAAVGQPVGALLDAERQRVLRQAGQHLLRAAGFALQELELLQYEATIVRLEAFDADRGELAPPSAPALQLQCAVADDSPGFAAAAAQVATTHAGVDWLPGPETRQARLARLHVIALLRQLAADPEHAGGRLSELQHRLAWRLLDEADQVAAAEARCRIAWAEACRASADCAVDQLVADRSASRALLDEAAQTLAGILQRSPYTLRASEIRSTLAAVLWEAGDRAGALDQLALLLDADPDGNGLWPELLHLGPPDELRALLDELGRPELYEPLRALR